MTSPTQFGLSQVDFPLRGGHPQWSLLLHMNFHNFSIVYVRLFVTGWNPKPLSYPQGSQPEEPGGGAHHGLSTAFHCKGVSHGTNLEPQHALRTVCTALYILIASLSTIYFPFSDFYFKHVVWINESEVSVVWLNRVQNLSVVTRCSPPKYECVEVSEARYNFISGEISQTLTLLYACVYVRSHTEHNP